MVLNWTLKVRPETLGGRGLCQRRQPQAPRGRGFCECWPLQTPNGGGGRGPRQAPPVSEDFSNSQSGCLSCPAQRGPNWKKSRAKGRNLNQLVFCMHRTLGHAHDCHMPVAATHCHTLAAAAGSPLRTHSLLPAVCDLEPPSYSHC